MRNLIVYIFLLISSVGLGISYQLLVYDSKQLPGNDFGQIKIRNRNVDIRFSVPGTCRLNIKRNRLIQLIIWAM